MIRRSEAQQRAFSAIRLRQQALGVKLRYLFEDTVRQPIPEEWLNILRRADEAQRKSPIGVGSNVRISVGVRQVRGRVTRVISRGNEDGCLDHMRKHVYWDLEYVLDDGRPARWKQNVDGGYVALA